MAGKTLGALPPRKKFLLLAMVCVVIHLLSCSSREVHPETDQGPWQSEERITVDSLAVMPLSILQYSLKVRGSDESTRIHSVIRFYDEHKKKLAEFTTASVSGVTYIESGNYTLSPPFTKYATIGVETDSAKGEIIADSLKVDLNIGTPKSPHATICDLNEYMRPFWDCDTIYNETILMYGPARKPASGKLMFRPDKILSIRSFDLSKSYSLGGDYVYAGNVITRTASSRMPFRTLESFDAAHDLAWFELQSQWVVVTYIHHDKWQGPTPVFKGDQLPLLSEKLRSKMPVTIAGYGMSITRGMNTSGYDQVAPYMPTYLELFTRQLKKSCDYADIRMINAGLPGSLVSWGAEYADAYINPLRPDLLIIDFGMNDFWRYTPAEFRRYVETIIRKVRARNPQTEFLLLSNMDFDPAYVLDSDTHKSFYDSNMQGYSRVMQELETAGIVHVDMTHLSDYIYQVKKAKDCVSNPLHPNDYLARWYAQSLAAAVIK